MGTAKRERQKANRQQRMEELEKLRRRQKTRRRGIQFAVIGPLAVLVLIGIIVLVGSKDNKKSAPTTVPDTSVADTSVTTTPAPTTTTVPPLPCPKEDGSSAKTQKFPAAPSTCIDLTKVYLADVTTSEGSFTIELDPGIAPLAVNNFVYLARYHYFDDTVCHYAVKGFVVQCGDPTGTGAGGPGYTFADELPQAGAYVPGAVAMANSDPNTNGSQFFIVTGDAGKLAPTHSLFGKVTAGLDTTLKAIDALGQPSGTPTKTITIKTVVVSVKQGAVASTTTTSTSTTVASTDTTPVGDTSAPPAT